MFDTLLSVYDDDFSRFCMKADGQVAPAGRGDDFRRAMRQVPGAVAILATHSRGERRGITATAMCSLSAEPAQLLVCVNRTSSFMPAVREAKHMSVNYLRTSHVGLARKFSSPVNHPEDRFVEGEWIRGSADTPLLADALVAFDCEVFETIERASHAILIARVTGIHARGGAPLLYRAGDYVGSGPLPRHPSAHDTDFASAPGSQT